MKFYVNTFQNAAITIAVGVEKVEAISIKPKA